MGKCNLIVVGGCHVAGYLLGDQPSFVDILNQQIQPESLIKKSNFRLQSINQLEYLYSHYPSDIVVLQLGNTELCPSFSEMLHVKKKNKNKSGTDKDTKIEVNDFHPHNFMFERVVSLASPLRWYYGISRNKIYLDELLGQMRKFKQKNFIILSPFPMVRDNYPRRRAAKYYKSLYGKLSNVTFIDLFDYIPSKPEYFNDLIHLNAEGHQLLAEPICDAILQIMEANNSTQTKKAPDMGQVGHIRHYSDEDCLTDNK